MHIADCLFGESMVEKERKKVFIYLFIALAKHTLGLINTLCSFAQNNFLFSIFIFIFFL